MDEFSPDRALSHSNGIAVQEEASKVREIGMLVKELKMAAIKMDTEFGITEELRKINTEKSSVSNSVQEALPGRNKVNNPDPSDGVFVFKMNLSTREAPVYSSSRSTQTISHSRSTQTISRSEERCFHYTLLSPSNMLNKQYKPLIRRNIRQEEIAFDRECKKLEIVWTNRGLPVDKESLHLAASKDAFDMSDLSESLPSTSASEKKSNIFKFRGFLKHMITESQQVSQHKESTSRRERPCTSERLSISQELQSIYNSLKECVLSNATLRRSKVRSQRFANWKRKHLEIPPSDLGKKPDCDKQKETSEVIALSMSEFPIPNWAHKDQEPTRQRNVCPEFAEMLLDDKPEEASRNSDVENNQESHGLSSLPKSHQDAGQSSSWDSERSWITDFEVPDLRVPLNSPVKEGKADKKDSFLNLKEKPLDIRQRNLQLLRSRWKLRALNSHRGVLSGGMDDESESENPSLEQASNRNPPVSQKLAETSSLNKVNICRKTLRQLNESVKNFRTFQNHFSHGRVKSDQVVPD